MPAIAATGDVPLTPIVWEALAWGGDLARFSQARLLVAPVGLTGNDFGAEAIETYMLDCRRDLEESLDYLAEYWRDDIDLADEDLDRPLEEVDPDAFREENEWRHRLEEEYLMYHHEFRERHRCIPAPGWRSEYAEEIRDLGYDTLLGD